jgi:hypothetical protein
LTDTDDKKAEPDEPDVVIDLLAEDAMLREALAEPLPVRLPTGKVISVPHMRDWPHVGSRYATIGAWDAWAAEVLSEEDLEAFKSAKLRNYQIERISEAATAAADVSPGKPRRSSGSRGGSRKR